MTALGPGLAFKLKRGTQLCTCNALSGVLQAARVVPVVLHGTACCTGRYILALSHSTGEVLLASSVAHAALAAVQPISCARHCGTTESNFHKLEPAGNFHSSQGTTYYATDLLPVRENKGASVDIQACTHVQLNITFKLILADFLAQCFRSFRKTVSLAPCAVDFGGSALSDLAHVLRSPCHRHHRAVASRPAARSHRLHRSTLGARHPQRACRVQKASSPCHWHYRAAGVQPAGRATQWLQRFHFAQSQIALPALPAPEPQQPSSLRCLSAAALQATSRIRGNRGGRAHIR